MIVKYSFHQDLLQCDTLDKKALPSSCSLLFSYHTKLKFFLPLLIQILAPSYCVLHIFKQIHCSKSLLMIIKQLKQSGCEVERRSRNHEVPSLSPVSRSQLWDFFHWPIHFGASTGVVPRKQNRERLV